MGNVFVGVDIGSSGVRAVLFNPGGEQVFMACQEYPIASPKQGWAELDPEKVFSGTVAAVRQCAVHAAEQGLEISGMGMSCQMHSLLAVNRQGIPITGAMLWADTRGVEEAAFIQKNYDTESLYYSTGCRLDHPMYPVSKILWLKNKMPGTFKDAARFITLNEYIIFKLFGEYLVDYSLAGCQGLFNVRTLKWEESVTRDILKISIDQLSQPVECTTALRGMRPAYAQEMGISPGIPFVVGGGDGVLASLGCGVFDVNAFSSGIGTSGAIRTTGSSPLLSAGRRTWCYPFIRGLWVSGGAINNGGLVLRWLRSTFNQEFSSEAQKLGCSIYQLFDRFANELSPGSDGLIFLPYLTGERCPDWNASARGIMFGLSMAHGKKHIVRASMEGILYRLYSVYEALKVLNPRSTEIVASGGYTKSKIWLKMQADLFNKAVKVSPVTETSALGAAYLAMLAVGAVDRLGTPLPAMKPVRTIVPEAGAHEAYQKLYTQAMNIYGKLYG